MRHEINTEQAGPRGQAMAKAVETCVHCGFCLPACPTYQELESEMDSPRGRILLMKSVLEGEITGQQAAPHVDRCLGCLACVTHCPSGVAYGDLLNSYRCHIAERQPKAFRLRDWLVLQTLPYAHRFRLAVTLGKIGKRLRWLTPRALHPMLDLVPEKLPKAEPLPGFTPAVGKLRGRVALLAGCAQQVLAPDINSAAIRVLSRNGIEVVVPPNQSCCGALGWHSGHAPSAIQLAERLIRSIPDDVDCLITTAAGCGSAIHEYPLLFAGRPGIESASRLSKKSHDISVYLDQLSLEDIPPLKAPVRVAYHDACHLAHAQGVRMPPRNLLRKVPGLELIEIADSDTCCGSAGTYNIQQPEIARKLGRRKAASIADSGATIVASGNIGCLVQIEQHLSANITPVTVLHTVQILDRAYREVLR